MRRTKSSSPERKRPFGRAIHEGFYRAFEDKYRGSRESVRSRLRIYLPFVAPLKSIYDAPSAVDLGCGRGEWLELLTSAGFDALGVDLDSGMLAACYENGLRATKEDAITFLEKLADESQTVISGFHIAEHLSFSQLQALVYEALRALKPAGVLILETPNPENFKVASLTFYRDPTHRNPLPPELLSFLPEYYGFGRVKILRLQENPELLNLATPSLDQVLGGASPDYAVLAQKPAERALAQLFDSSFDMEVGLCGDVLIRRFDREFSTQNERVAALDARLQAVQDAELARMSEALAASGTWARSLEADIVAKNEALAARDAELVRMSEALAGARSVEAELVAKNEALAARDAELAGACEAMSAVIERVFSLEADLLLVSEQLAAREAELARTGQALTAGIQQARSLEADLLANNKAIETRGAELARTREALTACEARARSLEVDLQAKNEALAALRASTSWRITAPLRMAKGGASWFVGGT